jgi:formate/nitrite transporter FocA (FNT family)
MLEVAKPIAVGLCMVSLCAVFSTAFLAPAADLEHRTWDTVILLSLTAGICLASGMIFRESSESSAESGAEPLLRTLPVQMFCWAVSLMLVLFLASWYLETHCVFYKDVRPF